MTTGDAVDVELTDDERRLLVQREQLSDLDWARALVLTKIPWGSSLLGAGIEFASTMRDERAAPLMRSLQYKLVTAERIQLLIQTAHK